jgi:hypothetical protein
MDTHPYRATGERIVTTVPFGDVDCGPTAGLTVIVNFSEGDDIVDEVAADVWRYFTTNYQDPFQTYRVVSATINVALPTLTIDLFTYWGDGHLSAVPGEPKVSTR